MWEFCCTFATTFRQESQSKNKTKYRMIHSTIDTTIVAQAHRLIAGAHNIVIFTHIAPDGDAMGSSLAMKHWIRMKMKDERMKDEVTVITPNTFPDFLAWLPGAKEIVVYEGHEAQADRLIAEADLHICLDFNEPKRIGPAGEKLMQNTCPKLLIDHHLMCDDAWLHANEQSVTISHPEASSTCELVYRVIRTEMKDERMKDEEVLDTSIATCIYTGLMTDTGNFSYNSNNPDLYEMIADLMRAGINKDAIYNDVFNQYSEDRVRLMGYCLYRKMRLFPKHHLALIALSEEELERFNFRPGDTEGIVNIPLQISDVYYSVFMREQPPKPGTTKPVIKVSFRSQGDRPVNIFAHEVFRGGGHANASGGEFYGTLGQAVLLFEKHYPKYLKKE